MEVKEVPFLPVIDSWDFKSADWANPNSDDPRYWEVVFRALGERLSIVYSDVGSAIIGGSDLLRLVEDTIYRLHLASWSYEGNGGKNPYCGGVVVPSNTYIARGEGLASLVREALFFIAPRYIDPLRLKEALKIIEENDEGEETLCIEKADILMPYLSYARLCEYHPDLAYGDSIYYRDTDDRKESLSRFLRAVYGSIRRLCVVRVRDSLVFSRSSGETLGMSKQVYTYLPVKDLKGSATEVKKGFDRAIPFGVERKVYQGSWSAPGVLNGIAPSLTFVCSGDLYASRAAMKSTIQSVYPANAAKAADLVTGPLLKIQVEPEDATRDPTADGSKYTEESGFDGTLYTYPRKDWEVEYVRHGVYQQEKKPLSGEYESARWHGGENRLTHTYLDYGAKPGEGEVYSLVEAENKSTRVFYWTEPRKHGDPDDKKYNDGEEVLGPLYEASARYKCDEYRIRVSELVPKTTELLLYTFPVDPIANLSSNLAPRDWLETTFALPPETNVGESQGTVSAPVHVKYDHDKRGFEFSIGTKEKFPEGVDNVEEWMTRYHGYWAYYWTFFDFSKGFQFEGESQV